jgi:HPt (histidine-containing phosphotransfer) domain-containing protein
VTRGGAAPEAMAAFATRLRRDRGAIAALERRLAADAPWDEVAARLAAIESLAHRLAGAAGTFGRPLVGEAARRVERLAERWRVRPPPRLTPRRHALLGRRIAALLRALGQG